MQHILPRLASPPFDISSSILGSALQFQSYSMPSDDPPSTECLHKTKLIHFLGRTTPIILQNENGPCPLLSICNVLLLKNNLNLSPDLPEVSQEKLLSLVAERLIDSNSNFEDKDPDYVKNQQQNISDALELLPRLTTGIDVNLKFTGIRDFEFTPECAIFDLLDIPLYHGWIFDPQDLETASAIGSKSYNRLMSELVSLETRATNENETGDFVDLSAATTATFGIPSPSLSLSRGLSFDELPHCVAVDCNTIKKGDLEENEALLRALKLSGDPCPSTTDNSGSPIAKEQALNGSQSGVDNANINHLSSVDPGIFSTSDAEPNVSAAPASVLVTLVDFENQSSILTSSEPVSSILTSDKQHGCDIDEIERSNEAELLPPDKPIADNEINNESGSGFTCDKTVNDDTAILPQEDTDTSISAESGLTSSEKNNLLGSGSSNGLLDDSTSTSNINSGAVVSNERDAEASNLISRTRESDTSQHVDEVKEPIYEGEEFMLDSGKTILETSEPIYEGEAVLAEQTENGTLGGSSVSSKDELTPTQGYLVQNFLKTNASQLTIHGLFCLQEGLKERELCVFFRNNHFNTMFKYEGELYLLATDQGYISQPDLVWEKLNEVNGNTVFMTSNFKEFKIDSHTHTHSETWNEQNARASTADYLSKVDNSVEAGSEFSTDLQLAIALQQQEFDQQQQPSPQPQRQQPPPQQQPQPNTGSRLITGPQVRRNSERSSSSSGYARQESKSKEKCSIM